MIAHIFLPERYGSFFLFSQRIASVMITSSTVRATILRATRSQRFIEELIEEPINSDQSLPLIERTINTLATVLARIPKDCHVVGLLPSTQVISKIIETPLMSLSKIKLIVPFEIESTLPFSLESALIDCVIIASDAGRQRAQVLVVATRQDVVTEYRSLFEAAGRLPDTITTDIVALLSFATEISTIPSKDHPSALLCVDQHMTIIMCFDAGRLQLVRTIPHGQFELFVGNQTEAAPFQALITTIVTTIRSVARPSGEGTLLSICGLGATHKEFCEALTHHIATHCELLTINKILHSGTIQSSLGLTNSMLLTVASALPTATAEDFNLDRAAAQIAEERLLYKQLLTGILLLASCLLIASTIRIMGIRSLKGQAQAAEKECADTVIKRLNLQIPPQRRQSLEHINREARTEVDRQKHIWFALATQRRSTPLIILQELSKRINREELGLTLQTLTFNTDTKTLLLEGEVKGFPELSKLETALLQSPRFKLESTLQELQFTAKLVLIPDEDE